MNEFLVYLIRASLCLIVFYLFYEVFFRRSTYFRLNRVLLLAGLVLSFVIPLLRFSNPAVAPEFLNRPILIDPITIRPDAQTSTPAYDVAFNFYILVPVLYFAGAILLLLRFLLSVRQAVRIKNNGRTVRRGRWTIVETNDGTPFSFFSLIFLPGQGADPLILEHEKVHVDERHWLDLLLVEAAALVLWFNPFVFLYKRSLKLQHEYLADARVTGDPAQVVPYLECICQQVQTASVGGPTSQFHCKTVKNRIMMMTKNKTSRRYAAIYLLALPLAALLTMAFSGAPQSGSPDAITRLQAANVQFDLTRPAPAPVMEAVRPEAVPAPAPSSTPAPVEVATPVTQTPPPPTPVNPQETIFLNVETMPKFQGGDVMAFRTWVSSQLKYPAEAVEKKIQGRVMVSFTVERDGKVGNIVILSSPSELLSDEVVRVVSSSPDWTPGMQRGEVVRVRFNVPIDFAM